MINVLCVIEFGLQFKLEGITGEFKMDGLPKVSKVEVIFTLFDVEGKLQSTYIICIW